MFLKCKHIVLFFCLFLSFFVSTFGSENFEQYIKYNPDGVNKIGRIVINDRTSGITAGTSLYVKKALEYYKEEKPIFIILELNTPGGEVFSAQNISDALREIDIQHNIPVVAYINNWAISAGAMLAYSSRFITATNYASMGAAEPVIAGNSGDLKEASEKVNSAMRSDMANRARFFGRNPLVAEAMVDKDIILVLRNNEFVKLDNEREIQASDTLISPKGKLLTLDSELLIKYHVANLLVPSIKIEAVTNEEEQQGKWPASKSALFHADFFKSIPNAVIDEYKADWKTNFFIFLANPLVASALFLGMMLGFYMEFSMPGTSLPGIVGFLCLLLIALSSFSLEIGNVLELILIGLGLLIILIELFVLPTFGLLLIVGLILFFAGIFGLMLPGLHAIDFEFDTQTLNAAGEAFFERFALLSSTFILGLILMALISKYIFPGYSVFNRFVLKGNEQTNYLAVDSSDSLPKLQTEGVVFADLRPAGKVMIDQNIYDAISYGNFIEKNTSVKVVGYESGIIVVNIKLKDEINT